MSELHELFDVGSVGEPKSMRVAGVALDAATSIGCECCAGITIDGGGGNGIAGIVNSIGVFGGAMNDG